MRNPGGTAPHSRPTPALLLPHCKLSAGSPMTNQTPVPITDSKDVWKRGLFMLLFAIAFGIGQAVLNASWGATTTDSVTVNVTAAPKGPTVATLDSNDPMNWLVKSVCVNASGNLLTADPYGGCPAGSTIRKLKVGEPLPYHNLHNINQLQQHDTIPMPDPSTGGTMVVMPFDFPPFNIYNLYEGSDGYDIYRVQGNWVTAPSTQD